MAWLEPTCFVGHWAGQHQTYPTLWHSSCRASVPSISITACSVTSCTAAYNWLMTLRHLAMPVIITAVSSSSASRRRWVPKRPAVASEDAAGFGFSLMLSLTIVLNSADVFNKTTCSCQACFAPPLLSVKWVHDVAAAWLMGFSCKLLELPSKLPAVVHMEWNGMEGYSTPSKSGSNGSARMWVTKLRHRLGGSNYWLRVSATLLLVCRSQGSLISLELCLLCQQFTECCIHACMHEARIDD